MTWDTVPLGEVAEVVSGATPKTREPRYWDGGIPWATPAEVSKLRSPYIEQTQRTISDEGLASSGVRILPANSVLLSSRAPIGLVAVNRVPMGTNQGFKSLVPGPRIDTKYLYWWLRSHTALLQSKGRGATFLELSKAEVERIRLAIPPLPEQRRIAAILDEADALRAKVRALSPLLEAHRLSIASEIGASAFSDRMPIRAFARVRTGSTPSRKTPGNYGGTTPWVKTAEVHGRILDTQEHVTEQGIAAGRLQLFPAGSVVVAMYGQGSTRGRAAVLGTTATTNQACAVIEANESFEPDFLHAQLTLDYERLRGTAEGGTQPNLSVGRVADFEVSMPPIDTQRRFTRIAREIDRSINAARARAGAFDALFASLQHRAFRGKL